MQTVFDRASDFFGYSVFNKHLGELAAFLPLQTVVGFGATSKYFYNQLNDPKSAYAQCFWKGWAVRNGGIKKFKGKSIDFKFKLMQKKLSAANKLARKLNTTLHTQRLGLGTVCRNCNKPCCPLFAFEPFFRDTGWHYCNCRMTDCLSEVELMKAQITRQARGEEQRQRGLLRALEESYAREAALKKKLEATESFSKISLMRPALLHVSLTGRTKSVRQQALKALGDADKLHDKTRTVRANPNYKADSHFERGNRLGGPRIDPSFSSDSDFCDSEDDGGALAFGLY